MTGGISPLAEAHGRASMRPFTGRAGPAVIPQPPVPFNGRGLAMCKGVEGGELRDGKARIVNGVNAGEPPEHAGVMPGEVSR